MAQEDHIDPSLAGGAHVTSADGGAAVPQTTLSLSDINQFLGKDFKDAPTALKALKDTQDFVGKRVTDIEADVRARLAADASAATNAPDVAALKSQVGALTEQTFYNANPQYREYAALIKSMGANPADVVENPVFKDMFAKGQVADQATKARSVVSSNGRVAAPPSVVETAVKIANAGGSASDMAESLASAINKEAAGQ